MTLPAPYSAAFAGAANDFGRRVNRRRRVAAQVSAGMRRNVKNGVIEEELRRGVGRRERDEIYGAFAVEPKLLEEGAKLSFAKSRPII